MSGLQWELTGSKATLFGQEQSTFKVLGKESADKLAIDAEEASVINNSFTLLSDTSRIRCSPSSFMFYKI